MFRYRGRSRFRRPRRSFRRRRRSRSFGRGLGGIRGGYRM